MFQKNFSLSPELKKKWQQNFTSVKPSNYCKQKKTGWTSQDKSEKSSWNWLWLSSQRWMKFTWCSYSLNNMIVQNILESTCWWIRQWITVIFKYLIFLQALYLSPTNPFNPSHGFLSSEVAHLIIFYFTLYQMNVFSTLKIVWPVVTPCRLLIEANFSVTSNLVFTSQTRTEQ